jgi:hypothetical protein
VLEVRAPQVRCQRMVSVPAPKPGDPRRVPGLLPARCEEGQRALVMKDYIRRPADFCKGGCPESEIGIFHRYQVFVLAAECLEQVVGEKRGRSKVPRYMERSKARTFAQ